MADDHTRMQTSAVAIDPEREDSLYRALQAYILFLKALFRSREPGRWRWSENADDTEILITGRSPLRLQKPEQRPAIVVVRQQAMWSKISLDGIQEMSFARGERLYSDMISSAMVIHCLGKEPEVASGVAWIVFRALNLRFRELQALGHIHKVERRFSMGQPSDPGSIVPGSSEPEYVDVPITSPFFLQETIRVTPDEDSDFQNILREITMTVTTTFPDRRGDQAKPKAVPGGSWVDISRQLPGQDYQLNPPSYRGRPLVIGQPDPVHASQESESVESDVKVGSKRGR